MARIMAIANQKGGVGKSTTAVNLGAALAERGSRVLVVDLDPQGNASTGMGIRHEAREITVYDVVVAEAPVFDAVVHTAVPGLDAVPSTIDLAGAEIELVSQFSREARLKKALAPIGDGTYDFVLLDCPPSLGLLTINALTAAEELIVPIQCEYYALEGLGQLLRNVNLVQQNINPALRLTGIVMTMFDPRTRLSEQVVDEVRRFFGDLVYDVIIPRSVRLSEAPGFGQPITVYDPRSKGAETYRELAREVAIRPAPEGPMATFEDLPTVVVPPVEETASSATEETASSATDESDVPRDDGVETRSTARVAADRDADVPRVKPPAPTVRPPDTGEAPSDVSEAPSDAGRPDVGEAPAEAGEAASGEREAEPARVERPSAETLDVRTGQATPGGEEDLWEEADRAPEARVQIVGTLGGDVPERHVVVIDDSADLDLQGARERPGRGPGPAAPEPDEAPDHDAATIGATLEDEEPGPRRRWRLFRKGGD